MTNSLLANLHTKVDFDNLYYKVPNNTLDSQLIKQLIVLVDNNTYAQMTAYVPTENIEIQQAKTQHIFAGVLLFAFFLLIFFHAAPTIA